MIGRKVIAKYGYGSAHRGVVCGFKTTTIKRLNESIQELLIYWYEAGESSGTKSWLPECVILKKGEKSEWPQTNLKGKEMGFFWEAA
tara:strand:- start:505 stop:765 length:261 start_codon:yes stop_codon:yes gene_type:complete